MYRPLFASKSADGSRTVYSATRTAEPKEQEDGEEEEVEVEDNPRKAILICAVVVAALNFVISDLNKVFKLMTMFYLQVNPCALCSVNACSYLVLLTPRWCCQSYAIVNLACAVLTAAGAPNFRPAFQYFSRYTAVMGVGCSLLSMWVIDSALASASCAVAISLFMWIHHAAPATNWGEASQAIIYHQVRKFLLHLDARKSTITVKNWRPQVLLLIADPRKSARLIDFVNDMKKGGLYILAHVVTAPPNRWEGGARSCQERQVHTQGSLL